MKNKIVNAFLVIFFLMWTVGAIYIGHNLFPIKIETPPEVIKPTVHELQELAKQIAEPEIKKAQKAKEYWENLPPVTITVPGKDSIHYKTKLIYPKGSIDISKSFDWSFVFENEDRPSDSLKFTSIDSLTVTSYKDSTGATYIGYSDFTQSLQNMLLSVNPKIYREEIITPYAVFLSGKAGFTDSERIINNVVSKQVLVDIGAGIGVLVGEDWSLGLNVEVNKESQSFGIRYSKTIFKGKVK